MNAVYYVRREEANGQITIESVEYGSKTHWNIKDLETLKIYEPFMGERRFIGKTRTDGQESYVEWLQVMRKKISAMIITGAIVERIATRKDKTAAITIGTQELNPKLASDIFGLNQSFCYVAFKSEQFTKADIDDIEKIKTDLPNLKTPSQRLRAVMFLNFQNHPEGFESFDMYYANKMETIIEHFKTKIDG